MTCLMISMSLSSDLISWLINGRLVEAIHINISIYQYQSRNVLQNESIYPKELTVSVTNITRMRTKKSDGGSKYVKALH